MKRIVTLLATGILVLVLGGCGLSPQNGTAGDGGTYQEAEQTEAGSQEADAPEERGDDNGDDAGGFTADAEKSDAQAAGGGVVESGTYTSKDEVALYLHSFGHLPSNYVTKDEAEDAGWKTEGLDLSEACPGKSIGGDRFGNREKELPTARGRQYYECDIDYAGSGSRGPKRLVYSNDGLIFYTEDHYQSFEQLY